MKYRIVKDAEKAKQIADSICPIAGGIGIPLEIIRNLQNVYKRTCEKLYFVEKSEISDIYSDKIIAWKEIFSSKTEQEARTFLEWLKNNRDNKQEVIHEEEF